MEPKSITDRIKLITETADGLEDDLKPFVKLHGQLAQARDKARTKSDRLNFWSYDGPYDHIDYHVRWEYSDANGIIFYGTDRDGDLHSWTLPTSFFEEHAEAAAELVELEERAKVEKEAAAAEERRLKSERDKEARRRQYHNLKREFENEVNA